MINVNLLYPVGSIYISINSTNPGNIFGGTWERIKGKMLVGVDEDDVDLNQSGKTGGEKEVTLTIDEMPSHNHSSIIYNSTGFGGQIASSNGTGGNRDGESYNIGNTGGGQAHNNMPPYYSVYIFVRTA